MYTNIIEPIPIMICNDAEYNQSIILTLFVYRYTAADFFSFFFVFYYKYITYRLPDYHK